MRNLKAILAASCLMSASAAFGQYATNAFTTLTADRTVYFNTTAEGQYLPILWGLDTAWPDEYNMRRGVRFIGAENLGVARVSFQPWDFMLNSTSLTTKLESNLVERLRLVSYIGGPDKVKLVLNNDAPGDRYDRRYANPSTNAEALKAYCNLIYATTVSCINKGWEVVTASPLNEPDYVYNEQGSMDDFLAIARMLKAEYPLYKDGKIRISGGNTLNCDQAMPWYKHLYDYIDEGNTHQLAGDFNHYADFFAQVRADGKYATADELHNVMEAMVGVEYGMQTGIWWGTAELARGEFCKASFGRRLAYSENRKAWTSAAVYRNPQGEVKAFVGSSERQAEPCSFRFVSTDRDVFYNGYGPMREYKVEIPGGYGYQQGQTNAECVVDITWGEDVAPVIDGQYMIMNKSSRKVMSIKGTAANGAEIKQYSPSQASAYLFDIKPVPNTVGGDFSYYFITLANTRLQLDVINWSIEEGATMILYDGGLGHNEQWFFKYAGDGYFRIYSHQSGLCLQLATQSSSNGISIVQMPESDNAAQLWRLLPPDAMCELTAPEAPTDLTAESQSASVMLKWTPSKSNDVASYTVLRAPAGTDEFNTIGRGITTDYFVDNTVNHSLKYDYKVKAIDKACNTSATTAIVTVGASETPGLVGRWRLNNDLTDVSDNHFDATTSSNIQPSYGNSRIDGEKCLKLAAGTFLQLPYGATNNSAYTLSAWIKPQSNSSVHQIFSLIEDEHNYISLSLSTNNQLELIVETDDSDDGISGGVIDTKEWHHVAMTVTDSRIAIFVDGKLVGEVSLTLQHPVPVTYVGKGQDGKTTAHLLIQDLRAYNFAVSDLEVEKLLDDNIDGISAIDIDNAIIAVEYYTPAGVKLNQPATGVNIVRRIYSNGTVTVGKELK